MKNRNPKSNLDVHINITKNLKLVKLISLTTLTFILVGCVGNNDMAFWVDCSYKPSLTSEEELQAIYVDELETINARIDTILNEQ